jgi:hypothetical protein
MQKKEKIKKKIYSMLKNSLKMENMINKFGL